MHENNMNVLYKYLHEYSTLLVELRTVDVLWT